MRLLIEAKQIVRGLTDTEALLKGYDQGAESARRFTRSLPKTILRTWAEYFPEAKREPIPRLAFLGGHPRSGTTLLEQVLDAHPGVAALDEPTAFLDVLQPEFHKSKELSSARLNTLRRLYTQALLREAGPAGTGKLLLDKNPSPTARLPLWLKVFPELRVLIALRDPRDVVLSCYFQNIPLNAANVNFLSFERLARHYARPDGHLAGGPGMGRICVAGGPLRGHRGRPGEGGTTGDRVSRAGVARGPGAVLRKEPHQATCIRRLTRM